MTEGYYPGSKQRVRQYETVDEWMEHGDDDDFLETPRKYLVDGVETEFYTIGTLARVLNRKSVTIRKWEMDGTIPKARYSLPSGDKRGRRRLYTRRQITGMKVIAREEGLLLPNVNGSWKSIEGTDFRKKVIELFRS
jgi:hypothetical protein